MLIRKLIGYRGWKVWMSYDMHISLLTIFYVLIVNNLFRPLDSLVLISSLGFYFMYGFLINDFCDMSYDIAVGKKKAVHELPNNVFIAIILVVLFISALHLLYLKTLPYVAVYTLSYILATLYSAPPVRFKSQGFFGIVINALIEKMLPVLAIFAFFNHFGLDTLIFLAASFSIGLIEIMTHQIYDYKSDLITEIHSFVVKIGISRALKIFKNFINPISAMPLILLCYLICVKVTHAILVAIFVFIVYGIVFVSIKMGKLSREEAVFPLYISCLFSLINNAFPLFLSLVLSLQNLLYTSLLLISAFSQYYIVKYRFASIKEKVIPHMEIFTDE